MDHERWKWRPYKARQLLSKSICAKIGGNGLPSADHDLCTAARSPDTAMLFAPFGCTHPPPLVPPFLLTQSLSPKDIAGCDIMKLKVSRCRYKTLGLKVALYLYR